MNIEHKKAEIWNDFLIIFFFLTLTGTDKAP